MIPYDRDNKGTIAEPFKAPFHFQAFLNSYIAVGKQLLKRQKKNSSQ
jgi:hypothetical protein